VTGPGEAAPTSLTDQLLEWGRGAVPVIAGAIGFTGWIGVLGAAVVWMRFSTAGIPADQAVHDLPLGEMLVTGAVSLILYLILGLIGVLLVYLLQGIVISRVIGDERSGNPAARLQGEIAQSKARLTQLEETMKPLEDPEPEADSPRDVRLRALRKEAQELATSLDQASSKLFKAELSDTKAPQRGNQWGLMVLVAAELVLVMLRTDISATGKVLIAIAAVLAGITVIFSAFATPEEPDEPPSEALAKKQKADVVIRAAVAAMIAVLAIILVLARHWTFAPVLVAIALAFANLALGRLHPHRFFWYGISIFASVGLFGAVLTYSRDQNAPSAQPAAVLLKNGCAVRGLWIGEGSSRVFLARLGTPEKKSEESQPTTALGAGRVFWVEKAQVATESVGKLQRVKFAVEKSTEMRAELLGMVEAGVLTDKQCETIAEKEAKAKEANQSAKSGGSRH
jgi:hypothetical protein